MPSEFSFGGGEEEKEESRGNSVLRSHRKNLIRRVRGKTLSEIVTRSVIEYGTRREEAKII